MEENTFVSFIIPTFNSEDTLDKCLMSINNISYPKDKFEIIIVDNGSKDVTIDIAKRFTNQVFGDKTATIGKLRNIGAKNAKGEILVFVDSDCVISTDWLINAKEYFKDSSIGLVGSITYHLPEQAGWIEEAWKIHLTSRKGKKYVKWVVSRAMAVRKDVFHSVGGFSDFLITCEDVEFGYRVNKKYRVISDEKLAPLHLKNIKTLLEFFKKESWRGKDSLKLSLNQMNEAGEIFYLIIIGYYLSLLIFFIPSIALVFIIKNMIFFFLVLVGLVLPLLISTFNSCWKVNKFSYFFKLFILYGVYILARIRAIF